ncbi:hypothetical protein WN50_08980 [Limnoraphis robusta CS-951]|uniref:Uncharacterized protein n=1 Tax=Limnoraphis robusta CS-951 TaxID=1637645 RepID=A0A0F5YIC8_9CYAN|nr:hypothetical protein WN50_08980 [Limnoraphis robusta CS-951]
MFKVEGDDSNPRAKVAISTSATQIPQNWEKSSHSLKNQDFRGESIAFCCPFLRLIGVTVYNPLYES